MYQTLIYDKISNQDYIKQVSKQKGPAKKGVVSALIEYGTACLYGVTIQGKQMFKQDLKLALQFATEASNKNSADGMVLLAIMKIYGVGTSKDIQEAFNLVYNASKIDSSNLDIKYLLAHLFFNENYQEITVEVAVQCLFDSGRNDSHVVRQAMGELGKLYYEGKFVQQNLACAIHYLSLASESYSNSRAFLTEATKLATNQQYALSYDSKPKLIFKAVNYIKSNNNNTINAEAEALLEWGKRMDYPPAMYHYAAHQISKGSQHQMYNDMIERAAKKHYLPAINDYVRTLYSDKRYEEAIKFAMYSVYFRSNEHQNTIALIYRTQCENVDKGIYFRYRKYCDNFDKFDQTLMNEMKLASVKDGNPKEMYNYAVCLENGLCGLEKNPELAVQLYKLAADKNYKPAARNYAHFLEYGDFVQQDFNSALKYLEGSSDIEYRVTTSMVKMMLSGKLDVPFEYRHALEKVQANKGNNLPKSNIKIARLLLYGTEMVPHYAFASRCADRGSKTYPLGTAFLAYLAQDPRAGKPNVKKAEKLFAEAMAASKEEEIQALYNQFMLASSSLVPELQSNAADVPTTALQSTRPKTKSGGRKSITPRNSCVNDSQNSQLTSGKELFDGYLKTKEFRYLERSADAKYPPAEAELALQIITKKLKKQYKDAVTMLEHSSSNGNDISYVLLGYMYQRGIGVKTNHSLAINNFVLALEKFEFSGYYGLSYAYAKGLGVAKDPFTAYRYFQLGSTNSLNQASLELPDDLFPKSEIDEIVKKVSFRNARGSSPKDLFYRGFEQEYCYKNYTDALSYYLDSIGEKKQEDVARSIAFLLMKSLGCSDEREKARDLYLSLPNPDDKLHAKWLTIKLETNDVLYSSPELNDIPKLELTEKTASDYLKYANCLYDGYKIEQDYRRAFVVYAELADMDIPDACNRFAFMLDKGLGVSRNQEEASKVYVRSVGSNNLYACVEAAKRLAHGDHIFVDRETAFVVNELACKQNHKPALDQRSEINRLFTDRTDIVDPCDEQISMIVKRATYRHIHLKDVQIVVTQHPSQSLRPLSDVENKTDHLSLLEKGIRFMKGYGIKKNYNEALTSLAQSIMKGNSVARIYYAILARILRIDRFPQIYAYNMYKAKLNGLSLAYVEEAKVELGFYEGIPKHDLERAKLLLNIAINANDDYASYIKGRYLDDEVTLTDMAYKGYAKANYYIGKRHLDMGNIEKAKPFLEKAAPNHNKAKFFLGLVHLLQGDAATADSLMRSVCCCGVKYLPVRYARQIMEGGDLRQLGHTDNEVFNLFQYAHSLGDLEGTFEYAICLRDGIGCEPDISKASKLFEIGCDLQIPEFFEESARCHSKLKGFSNWKIAKNRAKTAKKINLHQWNKQKIKDTSYKIIDSTNIYQPKYAFQLCKQNKLYDLKQYVSYLEIATNLGLFAAMKETILHSISGLYLNVNANLAFSLVYQLIDIGWPTAYKLLGDIYFAGSGVKGDINKAYHYYKKATVAGSKSGMYKLGHALIQGIGCEVDVERGIDYIKKSNCKYAYYYLTKFHSNVKLGNMKDTPNCLSALSRIVSNTFTLPDLNLCATKDLKYGILSYHRYYSNFERSKITPMSMVALKWDAISGSYSARFHYGFEHFNMGHYTTAIPHLKIVADEDNNYHACHYLGIMYLRTKSKYHDLNLAKHYLSLSATHLNNVDDMWMIGDEIEKGKESEKWLNMAADKSDKYRLPMAVLYMNGSKDHEIEQNPDKADYYFRKCIDLTYEQKFAIALAYYENDFGMKTDYAYCRELMYEAARMSSRTNEKAAKFYIALCVDGKGGYQHTPWDMVEQVADSNDPDYEMYSYHLACHLVENKDYNKALHYADRSGARGAELASKIRSYLAELERQRRQQEEKDNGSFFGALFGVAAGLALVAVAPQAAGVAIGLLG